MQWETVKAVARRVGLHISTLYRWIKTGKVAAWRPHRRVTLVNLDEVRRVARGQV